jgi:hypothetical protein
VRSDIGIPGKIVGREEPSWIFRRVGWVDSRPRMARWWREWPIERLRFEGATIRVEICARWEEG